MEANPFRLARRTPRLARFGLALVLAAGLVACGRGGDDQPPPPPPPLTILTPSLPDGTVGFSYSVTLSVVTVVSQLTWSQTGGTLPDGLSLDSAAGTITGTPTQVGTFMFTIEVSNDIGQSDSRDYTVRIGAAANPLVERVSVASDGTPANGDSGSPAISGNGRFIAFTSFSDNLVPNDTNIVPDIFLRDRACGATVRVSVASDGTEGSSQSFAPAVSSVNADTLFVAYVSDADNLVANDTNSQRDVFVTAVDVSSCPPLPVNTARVNVADDGSEADAAAALPSISADGRFVAYSSFASNLVPGDSNAASDIFVSELQFSAGVIAPVRIGLGNTFRDDVAVLPVTLADIFSSTTIGNSGLMLTPDAQVGRQVEIVDGTGTGQRRGITANTATTLTVSRAWSTVPDDTSSFRIVTEEEQTADIFSETTIGNSALAMSEDEKISSLVEIVAGTGQGQIRDITANDATTLTIDPAWDTIPDGTSVFRFARQPTASSFRGRISADGAFIAFHSAASGRQEALVHDQAAGRNAVVSLGTAGPATSGTSSVSAVSGAGGLVLFQSTAPCLLVSVPNTSADIFSSTTIGNSTLTLTDGALVGQRVEIVSGAGQGQSRNITANDATTLTVDPAWDPTPDDTSIFRVCADTNSASDLFIRDRIAAETARVSLANDGSEANSSTDIVADLSGGGRLVAFASLASNLVADDRNLVRDVFLRDRQTNETRRLSLGLDGVNSGDESFEPAISLDGTTVVFTSAASNLVLDDNNNARDIFLVETLASDSVLLITSRLPAARQGAPYAASLHAVGGKPPLFWSVVEGGLPPGLFLDPGSGTISGMPQKQGRFQFRVLVTDAGRPARRSDRTLTLTVGR